MKLKDFILGIATGVAATIAVQQAMTQISKYAPADNVLNEVKNAFLKEGPIEGSWIVMQPEEYQNGILTTEVYRGGITRLDNGNLQQFEFVADAKTGTLLNVTEK
ncbi:MULTISPECIES: PepSY domain-containing protein [Savagea]|uniref:PepSY domain-containing protein n=2 Tax=Savagea TaxID=1655429 RepID=A0A8J7KGH2_9BACL|nr:PepSY domain-containing protein [Savagea serpentis]MBF4499798.1 PepSY domain-containing protein [Savagea serpentis]